MQNTKKLEKLLEQFADNQNYIFTVNSFYSAFPEMNETNLNQLLCRANKSGLLERVGKGVYLYTKSKYDPSIVLFLVARMLRHSECMYVSLETVLSSLSVISQQMTNYITIVTNGRSGVINCFKFGKIEFVHSDNMKAIEGHVRFDSQTGLFWADKELAFTDMKTHRRKLLSLVEGNI